MHSFSLGAFAVAHGTIAAIAHGTIIAIAHAFFSCVHLQFHIEQSCNATFLFSTPCGLCWLTEIYVNSWSTEG
jgi:hypothetical protein